ncbi:MAG: Aminopeptidase YwaD precursor [Candidatus Heimdallarchaeota archaeon LC_3]|nr:MAG: Aminopeptidase YwaD precursor [Candidatus Heimdallarchaeota archaeon LC_3]
MKNKKIQILFPLAVLLLSFPFYNGNSEVNVQSEFIPFPDTLGTIARILETVSEEDYKYYVDYLALNISNRPYNSDNNDEAIKWIKKTLIEESNYKITTETIGSYHSILGKLVSRHEKSLLLPNTPVIVLSAHFDSVPPSPGADDNGSGTALLLYLAKILSTINYRFLPDILFSFNNAEENGLLGSKEVASRLVYLNYNVDIVINADMILYGPPRLHYNDQGVLSNGKFQANHLEFLSDSYLGGYITATDSLSGWTQSDHYSFFAMGYPAITIFERDIFSNPYYHSGADLPNAEGYNYSYPIELLKSIVLYIADMSRAYESQQNFHHYNLPNIQPNETIKYLTNKEAAIILEVTCEDECNLRLQGEETVNQVLKPNKRFYKTFGVKNLGFSLSVDKKAKITIFSGDDVNNDNFVDYVEEILFDIFFDEIDLKDYSNIYVPPKTVTKEENNDSTSITISTTFHTSNKSETKVATANLFYVLLGTLFLLFIHRKRKKS